LNVNNPVDKRDFYKKCLKMASRLWGTFLQKYIFGVIIKKLLS